MLTKAFIPYNGYYSSPFCRWQGSMANENSIVLGAKTARDWMLKRDIDPTILDYLYYGTTVAQHHMFFSHAWSAAMIVDNAKPLPALMVNQACTTSTTCIHLCAVNIENGLYDTAFALMSDRCSNGPHTVWPNPLAPGGEVESENWMMDNFNNDPNVGLKMIQTAENVAKEIVVTKEECDEVTLRRY
ncbi:MAG: thiolase family protein, partial [Deltaproteobacteria bacterium]|nr:thiolase family protein [Deltaproteobacteria bacterium]